MTAQWKEVDVAECSKNKKAKENFIGGFTPMFHNALRDHGRRHS
jgi:hypothetical protein